MDNKDLISQYVDTGLPLPEYQVMQLSSANKKTYIRKRLIYEDAINGQGIVGYEFSLLEMLGPEQSKKFYDKFMQDINFNNKQRYYLNNFKFVPEKYKTEYLDNKIKKDELVDVNIFTSFSKDNKIKFLNWAANRGLTKNSISEMFFVCSEELKVYFLQKLIALNGIEKFLENGNWKVANYKDYIWKEVLNLISTYKLDK
jgi:hypothetical protein